MRLRVSLLAAALLCGAAVLFPATVLAARGSASFALKPLKYDPALSATKSYFILSASPGDVIKDQIRVVNTGGQTGTAFLYPVDATTGQTSGAVYLSRASVRRDVGAWITLSRSSVTLAPGKNAVVDFTIRVPRTVRPGDHLGGVVAENSQIQQSTGKGALQIKIKHLTIDAVELQLPGRAVGVVQPTGVKAGGEHGYQYVYVHLQSSGTVMIKPAASLTVRNSAGRVVARRTFQLDTFLPGTSIDYPVLLPKQALGPGKYTAAVRLRSSNAPIVGYRKAQPAAFDVSRTFPFTVSSGERTQVFSGVAPVTPTAKASSDHSSKSKKLLEIVVGALGVLVVAILALLLLFVRRGRRAKAKAVSPAPTAPAAATVPEPTAPPVETPEEPGWAGLLAAYESEPRHRNGWQEHDDLTVAAAPVGADPEPVAPPEPAVVPEPVLVTSAAESELAHDFEPVVDYAPVGEYEPAPVVAEEPPLPEYEPVFERGFEPEPEPAAAALPPALDPQTLQEMIVEHDRAVADAYFRALPGADGPVEAVVPAPATVFEPARNQADANNFSTALLDASLIALAAVVAARLLKNDA